MANLTKLCAQNLKGQSFKMPVSPLMLVVGQNGAGKSTRAEALGILINGYPQGRGKRNDDVMQLASADVMVVEGELSTGFRGERVYTRTTSDVKGGVKVKVEQTNSIFPLSPGKEAERTPTQMQARISKEFGGCAIMLDWDQFKKMTDTERRKWFYEMMPPVDDLWNQETVREYIHERFIDTVEEDADLLAVYTTLFDDCMEHYYGSVNDSVTNMYLWAKGELSAVKSDIDDIQGAVRMLALIKNESQETVRGLVELRVKLKGHQDDLAKIKADVTTNDLKRKTNEGVIKRVKVLQTEIDDKSRTGWYIRKKAGGAGSETGTELYEDAETANAMTQKTISILEEKIAYARQNIKQVNRATEDSLRDQYSEIRECNEVLKLKLQSLCGDRASAERSIEDITDKIKKIQSGEKKCVVDPTIPCINDFTEVLERWDNEIQSLQNGIGRLNYEIEQIDSQIKDNVEQLKKLSEAIDKARADQDTTKKNNDDWAGAIRKIEDRLAKIKTDCELWKEGLERTQCDLDSLQSKPLESVQDDRLLIQQQETIQRTITEVEEQIRGKEKVQNDQNNQIKAQEQAVEASKKGIAFKELVQILGPKGLQGELIKATLEPIQSEIDECHRIIGISHKFYFQLQNDRGGEVFWMGWEDAETGERRDFNALSDSEQVRLMTALLTCYINRAGVPVRIMAIDNFDRVTAVNRKMVMEGLKKLVEAGKLDNVMLFGATIPPINTCGYEVINLWDEDLLRAEMAELGVTAR